LPILYHFWRRRSRSRILYGLVRAAGGEGPTITGFSSVGGDGLLPQPEGQVVSLSLSLTPSVFLSVSDPPPHGPPGRGSRRVGSVEERDTLCVTVFLRSARTAATELCVRAQWRNPIYNIYNVFDACTRRAGAGVKGTWERRLVAVHAAGRAMGITVLMTYARGGRTSCSPVHRVWRSRNRTHPSRTWKPERVVRARRPIFFAVRTNPSVSNSGCLRDDCIARSSSRPSVRCATSGYLSGHRSSAVRVVRYNIEPVDVRGPCGVSAVKSRYRFSRWLLIPRRDFWRGYLRRRGFCLLRSLAVTIGRGRGKPKSKTIGTKIEWKYNVETVFSTV